MSEQELAGDVVLKDGRRVLLRAYEQNDFEGLVSMYASLSEETLRYAMRPFDRKKIGTWITDLPNTIMLVALSEDKIIGHLMIDKLSSPIVRTTGELHIFLHQDFQSAGLGTAMIRESLSLARAKGLHRIGLSVVADNHLAIGLYEKLGFVKEGVRPECDILDDGRYHDLVEMGILFRESGWDLKS